MAARPAKTALDLARDLIRCPSVTPADAGALDVLEKRLDDLGFDCHRITGSEDGAADVRNLYARFGNQAPHFCFAGHTDVVPPGDAGQWSVDPFAATVTDGVLYGRGAADMKSAIAAFVSAAEPFLPAIAKGSAGSISLLITGDEEGPAVNGTVKVLSWLKARGEHIDHCLVGEPTSVRTTGDTIKIGRRGSVTGYLTAMGAQGHVAYPDKADNPIPRLMEMLSTLDARVLDKGTSHFEASNLEITTVDVGNPATNVIPATARAVFNIRHNDRHDAKKLEKWMRDVCDDVTARRGGAYELKIVVGGECFLTKPGPFTKLLADAVTAATGKKPQLTTGGGTSDARFIKAICPVAELGLVGETMHKSDERVPVADIDALQRIYGEVLKRYFAAGAQH